jgi:hypothetical protein
MLFQPIDQPRYSFSGAVDGPVKGPFPALIAPPWNGDPHAMLPRRVSHPLAALALVSHHAPGTALGPATSCPRHSAQGHQAGQHRGLMPLARRQDERHERAMAVGTDVDFRPEAALTAAERFGVRRPFFLG